jgi:hypothetical protein
MIAGVTTQMRKQEIFCGRKYASTHDRLKRPQALKLFPEIEIWQLTAAS